MTEYTAIPTSVLEAQKEAREFDFINQASKASQERKEQTRLEGQARIQEIEAEEAAQWERFWTLVHTAVGTIVILAGLAYLYSLGAMHGALAVAFALITAFGAGTIVGQEGWNRG